MGAGAEGAGRSAASASDQPARVLVTAVGARRLAVFQGPRAGCGASPPAAADAGGAGGGARGPSRVTFEVNPGKMQLRLSVEGAASQVLDSEIRDITVPDLTSPQVVLGTPEVFRARALQGIPAAQGRSERGPGRRAANSAAPSGCCCAYGVRAGHRDGRRSRRGC